MAGKFRREAARSGRCNKPQPAVHRLLQLIGFASAIAFATKILASRNGCSQLTARRINCKNCCHDELSLDKIAALRDQVLTSSRGLILSG